MKKVALFQKIKTATLFDIAGIAVTAVTKIKETAVSIVSKLFSTQTQERDGKQKTFRSTMSFTGINDFPTNTTSPNNT